MSHVAPERRAGEGCRQLGVWRPLFVVAICFFVGWTVFLVRQAGTKNDPLRLIDRGTVAERRTAALDLGQVTESADIDRVMTALIAAMEDTDAIVRSVAADSLSGAVCEALRRPAATPAEKSKNHERVALAVRAFTRALADPEPTVRTSAVWELGLLGKMLPLDLPPKMIAALGDESSSVRSAAATALRAAQLTIGVVPSLMKALESPDREVRYQAAILLGRVGPAAESAVPALLAVLKEPFDLTESEKTHVAAWEWDPACKAAQSLGQISASQPVIAGLIEMLSSDSPERRSCAAAGLCTLGTRAIDAVPALIAVYDKGLTSQRHPIGQIEISRAIARIAPHSASAPRAVAILIRAGFKGLVDPVRSHRGVGEVW